VTSVSLDSGSSKLSQPHRQRVPVAAVTCLKRTRPRRVARSDGQKGRQFQHAFCMRSALGSAPCTQAGLIGGADARRLARRNGERACQRFRTGRGRLRLWRFQCHVAAAPGGGLQRRPAACLLRCNLGADAVSNVSPHGRSPHCPAPVLTSAHPPRRANRMHASVRHICPVDKENCTRKIFTASVPPVPLQSHTPVSSRA